MAFRVKHALFAGEEIGLKPMDFEEMIRASEYMLW